MLARSGRWKRSNAISSRKGGYVSKLCAYSTRRSFILNAASHGDVPETIIPIRTNSRALRMLTIDVGILGFISKATLSQRSSGVLSRIRILSPRFRISLSGCKISARSAYPRVVPCDSSHFWITAISIRLGDVLWTALQNSKKLWWASCQLSCPLKRAEITIFHLLTFAIAGQLLIVGYPLNLWSSRNLVRGDIVTEE